MDGEHILKEDGVLGEGTSQLLLWNALRCGQDGFAGLQKAKASHAGGTPRISTEANADPSWEEI